MILDLGQTAGFLVAAMAVTVSPGPDNLMVLGLGMARGRAKGTAFGLGCACGCLSHTALAAVGVSAALAASPAAFLALRLLGGAYLIWLGIGALRSRGAGPGVVTAADEPLGRLFAKGLLANAVNPKVVLFFLAFLPQFIDPARDVAPQTVALGVMFTLQAALLFGMLGQCAGVVGRWLTRRPAAGAWLDRVAGGVFILLGLRLVVDH